MRRRLSAARSRGKLTECYRDFLAANEDPVRAQANTMLFMLLRNVALRPDDARVRRLNTRSRVAAERLLVAEGALAVLLAAGFERDGDAALQLPMGADVGHTLATLTAAAEDPSLPPRVRVSAAQSAAQATGELILRRVDLRALPPALCGADALKALTTIDLSRNRLREIPAPVLSHCLALEELFLAHNEIAALPAELHRLQELRVLRVEHNPLAALPGELSLLPHLADLSYSPAGVRNVPRSVMRKGSTAVLLDHLHAAFYCGAVLGPSTRDADLAVARTKRELIRERRRLSRPSPSPAKPQPAKPQPRAVRRREDMFLTHEVQDVAALRIQIAWRAFVWRLECWRLQQRKARDEPWPEPPRPKPQPSRAEQEWQRQREAERAVEEQARQRAEGRRRRRRASAGRIQQAWRRTAERRRSAVALQAAARGWRARRRLSLEADASARIGAAARGWRARRRLSAARAVAAFVSSRHRRAASPPRPPVVSPPRSPVVSSPPPVESPPLPVLSPPVLSPPRSPAVSPPREPTPPPSPSPKRVVKPEPKPEPQPEPQDDWEAEERRRKRERARELKAQRKAAWDKMVADRRRRQAAEEAERLRCAQEEAARNRKKKQKPAPAAASPVLATTRLQVERSEQRGSQRALAARRASRVGGGFRLAADVPLWQQVGF